MKPTALLRCNFSLFARHPAVAYPFLVRPMRVLLLDILIGLITASVSACASPVTVDGRTGLYGKLGLVSTADVRAAIAADLELTVAASQARFTRSRLSAKQRFTSIMRLGTLTSGNTIPF